MATRPSMQKISIAVERIAWDLLCLDVGDRVRSIDEYHNRLGVSSGTVKNALDYLESTGAAAFSRHGHEGTIVEHMDYRALQRSCTRGQLLGIMPLPYSVRYEGFATALCEQLSDLDFNMAYARGAESRIALVESSTCHFAVTSRYAALRSIGDGHDVAIAVDCGPGSFLSRHVLVFRRGQKEVVDGMKVAWDDNSLDQMSITRSVTEGRHVRYVPLKTQQTVAALLSGTIDAGVWNMDALSDNHATQELSIVEIPQRGYTDDFTSACLVVRRDDDTMMRLLSHRIDGARTLSIMEDVVHGGRPAAY